MTLFSAILILTLVMDPLGNIPVFLAALRNVPKQRYRFVIVREMLIALFILILFLLFGRYILLWMKLSPASLSVAGGLILLIISIKMIFPDYNLRPNDLPQQSEPFIVPLAVPMVAGPTSMTMVMLMPTEHSGYWIWLLAILIAWGITSVVLLASSFLHKVLKDRGLIAVERLMGMILVVMAVQMMLDGIREFFHI